MAHDRSASIMEYMRRDRDYSHARVTELPSSDSAYIYTKLILDSWVRTDDSDISHGIFKFNLEISPMYRGCRHIGIRRALTDIVSVQIGDYTVPTLPTISVSSSPAVTTTSVMTDILNSGALQLIATSTAVGPTAVEQRYDIFPTIAISELRVHDSALTCLKDIHFAFELTSSLMVTSPIIARVLDGFDTVSIHPPLRELSTLTIQITNGVTLSHNTDRMYVTARYALDTSTETESKGAAENVYVVSFVTSTAHGLVAGDKVEFVGFNCPIASINSHVNREGGLIVGTVGSTTSFQTAPEIVYAMSGTDGDVIPLTGICEMFIVKNRLRIPLLVKMLPP